MSISLSGSLLLTGSIVASGNLTTTGTITAQTLVVQTITSSIVNITGSNIFGSRTTDRQTFTGSLFITGSSANFSNQVCGLMGNFSCVGIGMTSPQTSLHLIRSLGSDVMSIGESGTNTRFAIGQEASYTGNYINSRNIDLKIQAYCAGGSGGNIIFQTGTDGTGCVTTKVFICSAGNMGIGTTSMSTEANLFLGAQGTVEGGQLVLQKGTSCSCATHLDNYQNLFRIMSGTDIGSTTVNMSIDHITKMACFTGTVLSTAPNNGHNFRGLGFSTAPIATGGSCLVYSSLDRGLYLISISSSVTSTYGYAAFLWVDSGAITVSSVIRQACVGITTSGRALCVVNQYGSETACMTINTLNLINYL